MLDYHEWYFLKVKPFEGHILILFFKCEGVFNDLEPKISEGRKSLFLFENTGTLTAHQRYKFNITLVKIVQLGIVIYVYIYLHTSNIQVYLPIQHLNEYEPDCDTQFFHPWTDRTLLKYWYNVLLLVKNVGFRPTENRFLLYFWKQYPTFSI